jgi:predicted DNA-binding transcriptional regulator AlpA
MDSPVGVAEVAELLNVSRQRVDELLRTDSTFPQPLAHLTAGRIWRRGDVKDWALARGRWWRSKTTSEEMDELTLTGSDTAIAAFRVAYPMARRAALGHGKHEGEVLPTRRAAYDVALTAARSVDPDFSAEARAGWFDEQ